MKKSKISIFSFFSGSGFLDLGFELNGFDIVFANEYHDPFAEAYKYSRTKMGESLPKYGIDVESIENYFESNKSEYISKCMYEEKGYNKIIGFIGGPPCPDFSVAGKNKGGEGENGKLSRCYIDLIIEKKPDFFVFENVKGLYKTKKHRDFFEKLKIDLNKAGYQLFERLVNSLEYGAPQDRERIILIGFSIDAFSEKMSFDWDVFRQYDVSRKSKSEIFIKKRNLDENQSGIPEELCVQYWFDKNKVETHPNSIHKFQPRAGLSKFLTINEGDDSKKSYKRLSRFRYSPTVAYGNNEVHIHPTEPRRISVAEALALQSLPVNFELPPQMTLTNMFKTIGNGVPYVLSEGLAKTIKYNIEK